MLRRTIASGLEPNMSPGIRAMLESTLALSLMAALVKLAGERIPEMEIVLVRGVLTLGFSYVALRRAGISPWGRDRLWLTLRGIVGFLSLSSYVYALTRLPLGDLMVLYMLNPLLVALAAAVFLREPLSRASGVGIAAGIAGVVLVARPVFLFGASDALPLDPLGVLFAFLSAVGAACAYVIIRRLRESDHPLVVVFQFPLLTVPLALPFAIQSWVWPTPREWLLLLGVGVTAQAGQVRLSQALQLEPAGRATAVNYAQIGFAVIWGALFFGESPTEWTFAGALLIAAGTWIVVRGREQPQPPPRPQPQEGGRG